MSAAWIPTRIVAAVDEAIDVRSFELESDEGVALPAFSAGSHIDVEVEPGLVRQYSLCNRPGDARRYQIAVLKTPDSRGGSKKIHELAVGARVRIRAPRNLFPLAAGAPASILVAGGIGITPILCMAERLAHAGEPFSLHYGARAKERAAFVERIERSSFADRASFAYADRGERVDAPAILAAAPAGAHLYVCGPSGFMAVVLGAATALGWESERLHREVFVPAAPAATDAATSSDGEFDIVLASSGKRIKIPAQLSVVQALAEEGIEVPTSCEQGVCGTCLTRVIDGTPDHRDTFLTAKERAANDQFTPCCSRAKSATLVLDL